MIPGRSLTIVSPVGGLSAQPPTTRWALGELERNLAARGVACLHSDRVESGPALIMARPGEEVPDCPLDLPRRPESLALWRQGARVHAWGQDERGLVYAITELADRAAHGTGEELFPGDFPLVESPTARVRSMARLFCSEGEDKAWFYDRQQWREYLTMLASNRFNRFAMTLGMGYNYPYHNPWITDVYFYFPYPFLFDLPAFDVRVEGLPEDERDANLHMLKFIGREAAMRGLEFQLALWTQRYDFDDVPRANYRVSGMDGDKLAPYCRAAVTRLLKEVPEITGLTFRVHVEGGIAEGEYGFWEEVFAGVAEAGRPVEIDMHGKGLDHKMLEIARATGMPFAASPKYLAEHMGLPYHQSAIREKEYPPEAARSEREKLSEGSRKFLRYSYGDLLRQDKDYKVIYRIWAGTQRVLLWGDPVFAAGYGRSSMFAGSDGVEWCEPLSFKGRMGTGVPGGRFNYRKQDLPTRYDWQKYAYQYRVWGRLLYNPEAPRESWLRHLSLHCGEAAEPLERALSLASRVLPLITLAHGPSASNNHYWPEIYTNLGLLDGTSKRAYSNDMLGPIRFGNAPTFDSELFASPREYVEALMAGEVPYRYSPLDVADWLQELAAGCEAGVADALRTSGAGTAETRRIVGDVRILAGIARYFAEKFRAACWAELFIATKGTELIEPAMDHMRRAVDGWRAAADASRDLYQDDLTYGPQSWLRGSWHTRLPEIEAELLDLEAARGADSFETVPLSEEARRAAAALRSRKPVRGLHLAVEAPELVTAGQDFVVVLRAAADAEPVLHYRHVNQAERWKSVRMQRRDGGFTATIPGSYTNSPYHLQYFVSLTQEGQGVLTPGLDPDLANEPYFCALRT